MVARRLAVGARAAAAVETGVGAGAEAQPRCGADCQEEEVRVAMGMSCWRLQAAAVARGAPTTAAPTVGGFVFLFVACHHDSA